MIISKIKNVYEISKKMSISKISNKYNLNKRAARSVKNVSQVNYSVYFFDYDNITGIWTEKYLPITSFVIRQNVVYSETVSGTQEQDVLIESHFKTYIQAYIPAPSTIENFQLLNDIKENTEDRIVTIRKTTKFTDKSVKNEVIAAAELVSIFEQDFASSNTANLNCNALNYIQNTGFNLNYPKIEIGTPETIYIDKIISKQQATDGIIFKISSNISVKPLDYVIINDVQYLCKEVNFWISSGSSTKNIRLV